MARAAKVTNAVASRVAPKRNDTVDLTLLPDDAKLLYCRVLVDLARVHVGWLPIAGTLVDTFHVRSYLEDSAVPVSVIHGTADDIVPSEQSAQVAASTGRLVEELVLPGAGHNDAVMFGPVVADVVARLADAVAHD